MHKYSMRIKWSEEDKGYIATIPELRGLSAFGETPEIALSELEIASKAFLEVLKETGERLPEPLKEAPYSGQLRLRMPKSLHAKLAAEAESEGVSLNTYIVSLLSEKHGKAVATRMVRLVSLGHRTVAEGLEGSKQSFYRHGAAKPTTRAESTWVEGLSMKRRGCN